MSNKIETYGPTRTHATARVRSADTGSAGATAKPAGGSPGDSLRITSDAVLMQQLEGAVAEAPSFNGARVAELRSALAQGQYQVDAEKVAARLVRMEWELGSRA